MTDNLIWTTSAACDLDPSWTSDYRPSDAAGAEMEFICNGCPVSRECAAYALRERAEAGFYAGVYVPPAKFGSRRSVQWDRARQQLRKRAGVKP